MEATQLSWTSPNPPLPVTCQSFTFVMHLVPGTDGLAVTAEHGGETSSGGLLTGGGSDYTLNGNHSFIAPDRADCSAPAEITIAGMDLHATDDDGDNVFDRLTGDGFAVGVMGSPVPLAFRLFFQISGSPLN
jgi:hypothetical protein